MRGNDIKKQRVKEDTERSMKEEKRVASIPRRSNDGEILLSLPFVFLFYFLFGRVFHGLASSAHYMYAQSLALFPSLPPPVVPPPFQQQPQQRGGGNNKLKTHTESDYKERRKLTQS